MARDYGNLGVVMRTRGDLDGPVGAEAMFRKALEIDEKLGRLVGMANQYGNLGLVMQTRGDLGGPGGAEAMYRKSLEISEPNGFLELSANQYANLGLVIRDRGKPNEARDLWIKSRDLYAKLGAPHMVQMVQGWMDSLEG